MDERLRHSIESAKRAPADLAKLDAEILRAGLTATERANILAKILYPEWMGREKIMFSDLSAAFANTPEAMALLLEQDNNPVVFLSSDLTAQNRHLFASVQKICLDQDFSAESFPRLNLRNLHMIDATALDAERTLNRMNILNYLFPYLGKKRKIIFSEKNISTAYRGLIHYPEWEFYFESAEIAAENDSDIENFAKRVKCKNLSIDTVEITDKGLSALCKITTLKDLAISSWKDLPSVSDKGLEELLISLDLETLKIFAKTRNVSGSAFGKRKNPSMKTLILEAPISDQGLLDMIENCPGLENLLLTDPNIIDIKTFEALKKLNLQALSIDDCNGLDDQAIKIISEIKSIKNLSLESNIVTDDDLENLSNLPHLTSLDLSKDCGVSTEGIDKFKLKLPNCDINLWARDIKDY